MSENQGYGGESMQGDYNEEINWDEVGNPPKIGDYNFVCESADYKATSNGGKHMIKCKMKIEAAVDPNNESEINRTVFTNFNFFASGAFAVKAFAAALDIPLPRVVNKAVLEDWAANHLVGAVFGASVKHRDWNEQKQADLQKFQKPFDLSGGSVDETGSESSNPEDNFSEPNDDQQAADPEPPPPEEPPKRSLREAAAAQQNGKSVNGKATTTKNNKTQPQARR